MKIAVNGRAFAVSEPGGAIQTGIHLTNKLASNPNYEVKVFGNKFIREPLENVDTYTSYYPINSQIYGTVWERTVFPAASRKWNADVLFSPNGNGPLHQPECKNIIYIHDVNAQKEMSSQTHQIYRKITVPRAASVADAIITVSEFSKTEICENVDVPRSKVHVVHNGIDEYYLGNDEGNPIDLPNSYILFVGSLNPRKNISRLIKSFKIARRKGFFDHKLVLVGPKNKYIFKNLDIEESDNILKMGFLNKKELKYVYENADLFAYPSIYEGFGLPPLEAMACGTPVLASETACFPEILGNCAKLVDPFDTEEIALGMAELIQDKSYRSQLISKGKKRASEFTWSQSVEDLTKVIKEIKK